jgi:hypothetical protein
MSIYGECFDIGQTGNCGVECPLYQDGECEDSTAVLENLTTREEVEGHIKMYPEDEAEGKVMIEQMSPFRASR